MNIQDEIRLLLVVKKLQFNSTNVQNDAMKFHNDVLNFIFVSALTLTSKLIFIILTESRISDKIRF